MKKKRKIDTKFFHARIRFVSSDYERIREAAKRRGLSHQELVRMASNFAAAKIMARPADDVLGFGDDLSTPRTEEAAA